MNHYQDISVRRVIAELVDDPAWPDVTDTDTRPSTDLVDLGTGRRPIACPRARGFRGDRLLQIREPLVARATASTRRSCRPRPGAHHDPAEPHGLVPRRGLRPPVGRGVLADEQGGRGPLRPVPGARRRAVGSAGRPVTTAPVTRARATRPATLLFGALSLDIYLGRDLVLPGGGVLNMAWALAPGRVPVPPPHPDRRRPTGGVPRLPRPPRHPVLAGVDRGGAGAVGLDRHRHPAGPAAAHGPLRRGRLGGTSARPGRGARWSRAASGSTLVLVEGAIRELHRLGDAGAAAHLTCRPTSSGFRHYTVERFARTMGHVDIGFVGWPGALDDPTVAGIRAVAFELGKLVVVTLGSRGVLVLGRARRARTERFVPVTPSRSRGPPWAAATRSSPRSWRRSGGGRRRRWRPSRRGKVGRRRRPRPGDAHSPTRPTDRPPEAPPFD